MQSFGIVVDDDPKYLSVNYKSTYLIYVLDLNLRLALNMDDLTSYIKTCIPNKSDI